MRYVFNGDGMTDRYIPKSDPKYPALDKTDSREKIERQVREFLDAGGKISNVEPKSAEQIINDCKSSVVEYGKAPI